MLLLANVSPIDLVIMFRAAFAISFFYQLLGSLYLLPISPISPSPSPLLLLSAFFIIMDTCVRMAAAFFVVTEHALHCRDVHYK